LFAAHLDIEYEFVESSWNTIIPDLTGKTIRKHGEEVEVTGSHPVRGDVIATEFTILPWREKIVAFSTPTFPTGVWLIARADSVLNPVTPSGDIYKDIGAVKSSLQGVSVLTLKDSCLDPGLYNMEQTGATGLSDNHHDRPRSSGFVTRSHAVRGFRFSQQAVFACGNQTDGRKNQNIGEKNVSQERYRWFTATVKRR
jgi:hypothetical protein